MLLDILKELLGIKFLFNFLGIKFQPDGELDDVELDAELGALNVAKLGGGGTLFKVPAAPADGFEAIFFTVVYLFCIGDCLGTRFSFFVSAQYCKVFTKIIIIFENF